jgi:hypothetical protein
MSKDLPLEQKTNLLSQLNKRLEEISSSSLDISPDKQAEIANEFFGLLLISLGRLTFNPSLAGPVDAALAFLDHFKKHPDSLSLIQWYFIKNISDVITKEISLASTSKEKETIVRRHISETKETDFVERMLKLCIIIEIARAFSVNIPDIDVTIFQNNYNIPEIRHQMNTPVYGIIRGDRVRLRDAPSYESSILGHFPTGIAVQQHDIVGEWVRISVPLSDIGGRPLTTGWVHSKYISPA